MHIFSWNCEYWSKQFFQLDRSSQSKIELYPSFLKKLRKTFQKNVLSILIRCFGKSWGNLLAKIKLIICYSFLCRRNSIEITTSLMLRTLCATWYQWKNATNTHEGMLLLVKLLLKMFSKVLILHWCFLRFLNRKIRTKSRKASYLKDLAKNLFLKAK